MSTEPNNVTLLLSLQYDTNSDVGRNIVQRTAGGGAPSAEVLSTVRRDFLTLGMGSAQPKGTNVWRNHDGPKGTLIMKWDTYIGSSVWGILAKGFASMTGQGLDKCHIRTMVLHALPAGFRAKSIPPTSAPIYIACGTGAKPPPLHSPVSEPGPLPATIPKLPALPVPFPSVASAAQDPAPTDATYKPQPPSRIATELQNHPDSNQNNTTSVPSASLLARTVSATLLAPQPVNTVSPIMPDGADRVPLTSLPRMGSPFSYSLGPIYQQLLSGTTDQLQGVQAEARALERELAAVREERALKRKRDLEVTQRLVRLRTGVHVSEAPPKEGEEPDVLGALDALEAHVRDREAMLQSEVSAREAAERQRKEDNRVLEDVKRECREPFVVPALLDAFVTLSKMGG